jgi:hypothetical protein
VEPVHVLLRRNGLQHPLLAHLRRQRQLHQDAVDARLRVERADALEHLLFGHRGRQLDQLGVDAGIGAGLDLAAHVDARGRIVADQDDGEAGPAAARLEGGDARAQRAAQPARQGDTVDDLAGHDEGVAGASGGNLQVFYAHPPAGSPPWLTPGAGAAAAAREIR